MTNGTEGSRFIALFLTMFAVSTVVTMVPLTIIFIGAYLAKDSVVFAGTAMLAIAVIAWTYVYVKVGWWAFKELIDIAKGIQRNPPTP